VPVEVLIDDDYRDIHTAMTRGNTVLSKAGDLVIHGPQERRPNAAGSDDYCRSFMAGHSAIPPLCSRTTVLQDNHHHNIGFRPQPYCNTRS
jgi:hypothetical protein